MSNPIDSSAEDRRAFLKGVVIATGAAAGVSAAAQDTARPAQSLRAVALTVTPKITPDAMNHALKRIYELCGCPTCGLNGILDLRVNVVNPKIPERLAKEGLLGFSENLGSF